MLEKLKSFFESNALAHDAAASIKDGREISLVIKYSDSRTESYVFTKVQGKNKLDAREAKNADLVFFIPESSAQDLVSRNFSSVGQVGLHIFEKMLSNDSSDKIVAKLNVGFLALMTGGYLGVLAAGGSDVAKFLAQKGLSSAGKVKDVISKMR